ncbi:MAG: hypothetical protein ABRQ37_10465 [Candidatus Eremiobacterota bacterium]
MKIHIILLTCLISLLISGCGGGGDSSGVIPNNVSIQSTPTPSPGTLVQVPDNQTTPSIPSYLPGGTFNVTVQFPGSDSGAKHRDMSASDLPYNSHTLRVTITGEAIITPLTGERNDLDPSGAGTYTLTVSDVPVGLNTAVIEVIDPSGNLLCQRKHGFYMTPGRTAGPGLIILGVTIQSDGSCVPQNIDIPPGTTLVYQNQDYDNDRTVQMNGGVLTVGPIAHAEHITQPATAEIFHTGTCSFPGEGTYNYDTGYGSPGRVLVYGLPSLTSITDSTGDNKDENASLSAVDYTLNGNNFGTSRESVSGEVRFIQTVEGDPNNPWGTVYNTTSFIDWSNTSVQGSIELPGGKYRVEMSIRGENTAENVLYYKGSGNFEVIVGDPNATPTATPAAGPSWGPSIKIEQTVSGTTHRMKVDQAGNAYLIWIDSGNYPPVIYLSYRPAGGNWGSPVEVATMSGTATDPDLDITVDSSGNACAVWSDTPNMYYGYGSPQWLYYSYRPSGGSWSQSMEIPGAPFFMRGADHKDISLTTDNSNNIYLLWTYEDMPGPYNTQTGIYFASCPPEGTNWNVYGKIDETPMAVTYNPSIAVDLSGNVFAIWGEYVLNSSNTLNHICFSCLSSGSSQWSIKEEINDTSKDCFAGRNIAIDLSGNAHTVWLQNDGSAYNVYSSRRAGGVWETPLPVGAGIDSPGFPGIAIDSYGNGHAMYYGFINGKHHTWSFFLPSGGNWTGPVIVDHDRPDDVQAGDPIIQCDGNGKAYALWQSSAGDFYFSIWQ